MTWTQILTWIANEIAADPSLATFATDLVTFILSLLGGSTTNCTPTWLREKLQSFKDHRGIK
jgi:hypothetical protein